MFLRIPRVACGLIHSCLLYFSNLISNDGLKKAQSSMYSVPFPFSQMGPVTEKHYMPCLPILKFLPPSTFILIHFKPSSFSDFYFFILKDTCKRNSGAVPWPCIPLNLASTSDQLLKDKRRWSSHFGDVWGVEEILNPRGCSERCQNWSISPRILQIKMWQNYQVGHSFLFYCTEGCPCKCYL